MPFAQVYMIEGRAAEQKRAVIEKVTQALAWVVGALKQSVCGSNPRLVERELGHCAYRNSKHPCTAESGPLPSHYGPEAPRSRRVARRSELRRPVLVRFGNPSAASASNSVFTLMPWVSHPCGAQHCPRSLSRAHWFGR